MKKIIFISPPFLHSKGKNIKVESDVYNHFVTGLKNSYHKFDIVKFITSEDQKIILDLNHLKDLILKDKNSLILIDGNSSPGDDTGIYPIELINVLKKSQLDVICFVPDLIKEVSMNKWIEYSKFIIATTKTGVAWANDYYKTKKFVYYPTWPVTKFGSNDMEDFISRPFDFGYVGSNKIFRINLISSILKIGGNKFSSIVISSYRSGSILNTTEKYLEVLSNCKFFLCTRAALKESYEKENLKIKITEGRYANRISEAIACGCIPLYFQPDVKNIIKYYINYFLYFSKISKMFNLNNVSGSKTSEPYDEIGIKGGFIVIDNPIKAINIIKSKDVDFFKRIKEDSQKIYNEYIDPNKFFDFILNK